MANPVSDASCGVFIYNHDNTDPTRPIPVDNASHKCLRSKQRFTVHGHDRTWSAAPSDGAPSQLSDDQCTLEFRTQVMKHCTANRQKWLIRERGFLEADRRAVAKRRGSGGSLAGPVGEQNTEPQQVSERPEIQSADSPPRADFYPVQLGSMVESVLPTHVRHASAINCGDKDFMSLPDYCPPLESLLGQPGKLQVHWDGCPIDLSNDPFRSLLHPDEVMLACSLRLDCAKYLTNKRRFFEQRLACLRENKEFRKTDAQRACRIDVNKASRLWIAFDNVGWLDAGWMLQYL